MLKPPLNPNAQIKNTGGLPRRMGLEEKNNIPERNGQCLINQREKGG